MTIYLGSRYENSTVDFLSINDAESNSAVPVVFYEFGDLGRVSYVDYIWRSGDRLDQVAWKFYKHPELWWVIAKYNPEIKDFTNIPEGTPIRIVNV